MTFSIRKASPEDVDFVLALFVLPHVKEFAHGPQSAEGFLKAAESGDREVLIIERNGRPFGNANFSIIDDWLMEIRVVAFEEQRTGAGRFTLQWLLRQAFNELRIHRAYLEVVEHNEGARALYESLGFQQEGRFVDGYRAPEGTYYNLLPYGMLARDFRSLSDAT